MDAQYSDRTSRQFVRPLINNVDLRGRDREPLREDDLGIILFLDALKSRIVVSEDTPCLVRSNCLVSDIVSIRTILRILRFAFLARDNIRHHVADFLPFLRVLRRVLVPGDDVQDVAGVAADVERACVIGYAVDLC